ncbi:isochorismate synthase DhbC [Paenibacillus bouchesdurhonensis]|uniref:isochorismate synthase DhbC n=1 Tax=Paenibacillus bouchesdurhonensis TaxID=1870990 RepID=UPI000DA60DFF|nr:isochorismate synthase DhbC [Paenibacillus bouchesdurhonensis]
MVNHGAVYAETAAQLLDEYESELCFFLSSPRRTLLAKGEWARVWTEAGEGSPEVLSGRVKELLKAASRFSGEPIVVGAIPFDLTRPAELVVPLSTQWAGPLSFKRDERSQAVKESKGQPQLVEAKRGSTPSSGYLEPQYKLSMHPEPEHYKKTVQEALNRMDGGTLQKIVLSRTLGLTSAEPVDIHQLLRNLAEHNEQGYTFAVNLGHAIAEAAGRKKADDALPDTGGAEVRTLIGASPELLITRTGRSIRANPLAGSAPRSDDPIEDERRAAALLASAKDIFEHKLVVDAVEAALRPYCKSLAVPGEPSLVQTETMWHLSTDIYGELADSTATVLDLALALHPTPAICGTPTRLAQKLIHELEPFERGYFTGMVGWCDAKGDGEWIVTIRCAEVAGKSLRLYAGAGVVADSTPEAELAETAAKFRTLLLAMGINDRHVADGVKEGY